jgi:hypothetical protein
VLVPVVVGSVVAGAPLLVVVPVIMSLRLLLLVPVIVPVIVPPVVVARVVAGAPLLVIVPVVVAPVVVGPVVVVLVADLVPVHVCVGGGVELCLEVLDGVAEARNVGADGDRLVHREDREGFLYGWWDGGCRHLCV